MKLFYKRALVFVILLFLSALGIDLIISNHLQQSTHRIYLTWNEMSSKTFDYDAVVFGSSEVWVGCNPRIVSDSIELKTYDCALDGSNFTRILGKYKYYEAFNQDPKVIVIVPTLYFLNGTRNYEKEQFFPLIYNLKFRKNVLPCCPLSWSEKYIPLYRYIGYTREVRRGLGLQSIDCSYPLVDGYLAQPRKYNASEYGHSKSFTFYKKNEVVESFKLFIQHLSDKKIQIIFAYPPLLSNTYHKITNVDEMYALYQGIADEYSIPILDYMKDDMTLDKNYFYNDFHLNKKGSIIWSQKLGHDIKQLLK